ncbi:hypothetical protein FF38_12151 [Lucilia cuprina]|uniref:Uncharacterized protein n=1 Tax=Lucilia cuprina TaxID=7375 RepID=A0A0L0CBK6_LUCCU|nr:hypothetical protein FF38_12151 [Lucilia cuprina]
MSSRVVVLLNWYHLFLLISAIDFKFLGRTSRLATQLDYLLSRYVANFDFQPCLGFLIHDFLQKCSMSRGVSLTRTAQLLSRPHARFANKTDPHSSKRGTAI